jgi:AAA+ ATPase superfamily predicted ATPase
MTDEEQKQEGKQTMGVIEYNADKSDVKRFEKAFVGVAANPGTTYNIQNAFHAQGYFGVKITLIGSNLSLLEGQEDGEVEALMEDANEWLEEWFKEICRWNPKDVE